MFSAVIVEDETLNREEFRCILQESGLPVQILGEASNGEQGLEKIREWNPDLVVTDIRMPRMDGIEMIRRAKAEGFSGQFIIVSGYAEFEYAHSAMELEIRHYLLKPLTEEEVIRVIGAVCGQIEERQRSTKALESMRQRDQEHRFASCMTELLLFREPDALTAWREFVQGRYYALGVLQWYPQADRMSLGVSRHSETLLYCMPSCMRRNERIFCVLGESPITVSRRAAIYAEQVLGEMFGASLPAAGGISRAEQDFARAPQVYDECLDALLARFTPLEAQLYRYRGPSAAAGGKGPGSPDQATLENLLRSLGERPSRSLLQEITQQTTRLLCKRAERCEDSEHIRKYLSGVLTKIFAACPGERARLLREAYYADWLTGEIVHQVSGSADFQKRMLELLSVLFREEAADGDIADIARRMQGFIDLHYFDEMQLDDLAAGFHVDTKYLSRVFKKVVGQTFSEYLTMVRLERAKELLRDTELSAHRIASMVGYADHQYFHRVFKGKLGMTPMEYREREMPQGSAPAAEQKE